MLSEVIVAGAGPTGLVLACTLARLGVKVRLLDKKPGITKTSRAIGIHARTLEIFEDLGIVEQVLSAGNVLHGINVYAHGRRTAHLVLDDLDSFYPYIVALPQSRTEAFLVARARSLGVEVEWNTALIGLEETSDAVIGRIVTPDRDETHERTAYIVGCDGAHSTVRKLAEISFSGKALETRFALIDLSVDWDVSPDEAHLFLSDRGVLMALCLDGARRHRLIADLPDKLDETEITTELFARFVQDRAGVSATLSDTRWASSFTIQERIAETFRKGRVFLAGDAAHIHSPAGGQGMNLGIQDAYNLAWKLAMHLEGKGSDLLLDSYEPERMPQAKRTVKSTDLATRVVMLRGSISQEVRDQVARFVSGLDFIQERVARLASGIGANYRSSAIVSGHQSSILNTHLSLDKSREDPSVRDWLDFARGPHPGDRAPDVEIGSYDAAGRGRLYPMLFDGVHTLLLFDGAGTTASGYAHLAQLSTRAKERLGRWVRILIVVPGARAIDVIGDFEVLRDPEGSIHERYGAGSECLYLIRPDGYVAFRSQPASESGLLEFLDGLFA